MNLKKITIRNFRSIRELVFSVRSIEDESYTYGLIGVNEAGKSNILKAIALKDYQTALSIKDFNNKSEKIEIEYVYAVVPRISDWYVQHLPDDPAQSIIHVKKWAELIHKVSYSPTSVNTPEIEVTLISDDGKTRRQIGEDLLDDSEIYKCIFWTAAEKYLISKPISLSAFAANPESVSIPLKNCFLLADYTDIKAAIANITNDSTEQQYLQETLGKKVTEHIRSIWPNHPITISFLINGDLINFHIQDEGQGKAKTADQRSDGFKQFISFLLTVSAENKSGDLSETILLLDEPETHLHPQAQEYLLDELKKITQSNRNNLVLFATHSNYMIDKPHLDRNYRVSKKRDITEINELSKTISTYASVTYEVFDIPSSDYHNELYSKLHGVFQDEAPNEKDREFIKDFDSKFLSTKHGLLKEHILKKEKNGCTLPTYIRNCIHHPDNGNTYTQTQLKKSLSILRGILQTLTEQP